ncbi:hypothetical protein Lalb_Chr03g0039751 [Lupinus albus]|uniref:Uncharacterized protein n=1 Tax=Lupinus albus TaxID=3870 RepID=A0A6A4QWN2_LUPAL|nr:hypothetical protein Lalb_Chr03g0039751 [Lupinus albus]
MQIMEEIDCRVPIFGCMTLLESQLHSFGKKCRKTFRLDYIGPWFLIPRFGSLQTKSQNFIYLFVMSAKVRPFSYVSLLGNQCYIVIYIKWFVG